VLAREAPRWLHALLASLCEQDRGQRLLLRRCGRAGTYRFWTLPEGVQNARDLEAATQAAIEAQEAAQRAAHDEWQAQQEARSAAKAAESAERQARARAAQAEYAERHGLVIVEDRGDDVAVVISTALADDGAVWELRHGTGLTVRARLIESPDPQ